MERKLLEMLKQRIHAKAGCSSFRHELQVGNEVILRLQRRKKMSEGKTAKKNNPARRRKLVFRLALLMSFLFLVIISSFISYMIVMNSESDKDKNLKIEISKEDQIPVEVPLGSTTAEIADLLEENGIISHTFWFKMLSKLNGYDGLYKSGTHIVSKKLTYDQLMIVLTGDPETVKITIPEGYTLGQITKLLSSRGLIDRDKFQKMVDEEKFDFKFLENVPERKNRLEGYLFPDTYKFGMKVGEKEIIKTMLYRFDDIYRPDYYEKAKKINLTTDEVIIIASMIEREAQIDEERRLIAGVIYNRLKGKFKASKKLEIDATIQYILMKRDGKVKEKLTYEDTRINDPYNTYLYEGLPPGPISCPGKESIEAALNPEDTDYLYYVAKGEGYHHFSRTLAEHKAAVKKYGHSK